jgi:hypothetical protein
MKRMKAEYEFWKHELNADGYGHDTPHKRETATFQAPDLTECYRLVWADGAKKYGVDQQLQWRVVSCREIPVQDAK